MPEPHNNPNPSMMVDPPSWLRRLMQVQLDSLIKPENVEKRRRKAEAKRVRRGERHRVDYFHQIDDPYAHLTAQIVQKFAQDYDIDLRPHLIREAGGKNQPELEKLA